MKSIIDLTEDKDDVTFPQMYRMNDNGAVILFSNKKSGTVIYESDCEQQFVVGYYSTNWIACCDTSAWTRLPAGSSITLIQEDTR